MPALSAYVAGMPEGLASYPDARCKGSLLVNLIEQDRLRASQIQLLPPALRQRWESPPLVNAWIPETLTAAAILAHLDLVFRGDEADLLRWFEKVSADLLRKPFFRLFFAVASPARVLRRMDRVWALNHRGGAACKFTLDGDHCVRARVEASMYPLPVFRTVVNVIEVTIRAAGGTDVRTVETDHGEDYFEFECRWS